ncbi:MAG TPA: dienelactone hydrolase family protein [Nitrolancea sp.]|nr:dienelactone hydrolase family protein [Nitrolancea sp.]
MCFSDSARVPEPPIKGEVGQHGDLTLTASDGNKLMAYAARAGEPRGIGLVILPDIRGLHQYYKDLSNAFAGTGIDTVAIDYFGRTAGHGERTDDWNYRPHVAQTTPEGVALDTGAAVAYLRSSEGGKVEKIFTVGFCFGGSCSWNQAAAGHNLSGSIGFYGRPERSEPFINEMQNPLLILIAGADRGIPGSAYVGFDHELNRAGVKHEMHTYAGAPHSFFDRTFAEWQDACADAWQRMLGFIEQNA